MPEFAADDALSAVFDALLDAGDPEAVLASIQDPALREAATKLWRDHLAAEARNFLSGRRAASALPTAFHRGQTLSDRFVVEEMLGAGGMGEVYLASDRRLGAKVAIKTISPVLANAAHVRRRFLAEVQNARRVTHRNICRIYEYFEDPATGAPYFTMEHLHGETLEAAPRPFAKQEARQWLRDLAEGLKAAHDQGILHGDFKPGNVILATGEGSAQRRRAVITDFGLARALSDAASPTSPQTHSLIGGTAEFTAPEILAGGPPSVAGDLYAYGKVAAMLDPEANWWKAYVKASPAERPATLKEALAELDPARLEGRRNLLIGAAAAAAVAVGGFWYGGSRTAALATIPKGARLLVNGIQAPQDLRARARALRDSFVLGVQQSPRLRLVDDRMLLSEVQRVDRTMRLPVPATVLQQLVERTRAAYWIESSLIERAGRLSWNIILRRASDGLAVLERKFANHDKFTAMAEEAAMWLRTSSGESEESLRLNPATVGDFTSQVPEALDRYSEAIELYLSGGMLDALHPFEEVVRLDPEFAQAHAMLGMCHNLYQRFDLAVESLERAMKLATKLPPQERSVIAANYFRMVEDPVAMVEESRKNVVWRPDDPYHHRQLANHYCWAGAAELSIPEIRKAIEVAPRQDMLVSELLVDLCEAGHYDEALAELRKAEAEGRDKSQYERGEGVVHLCFENYAKAKAIFAQDPRTPSRIMHGPAFLMGDVDAAISGWTIDRMRARASVAQTEVHELSEHLLGAQYLAGRLSLARQELLTMPQVALNPPHARRLHTEIFWASRLGEQAVAERAASGITKIAERWPNAFTKGMVQYAEAVVARFRGDYATAATCTEESAGLAFSPLTWLEAADIAELQGKLDLAAAFLGRFEALRGTVLKTWFPGYLLYGWHRGLLLSRRRGMVPQASAYKEKILRHWGAAQPQSPMVMMSAR